MRLLRRHQSQELDQISMDEMGISGIILMGKAGKTIAEHIKKKFIKDDMKRIAICCGKGNNGGDGFASALHLDEYELTIFSLTQPDQIQGDSTYYYDKCVEKNMSIVYDEDLPENQHYDLIIDALLGTGFHGHLRSPIDAWTRWINQNSDFVISVDIPSGVDADTGAVAGDAVSADITITMDSINTGLVLNPGSEQTGEVIPVDIGFPDIYDKLTGFAWNLFEHSLCKIWLKPPPLNTYKHRQGKVLIIAGSKGMTGAASLATHGALRSGAGLTVTCAPASLNIIYETNILEGMTLSCPDDDRGYFTEDNYTDIECMFDWADVILIGPGLGGNESTIKLVGKIISSVEVPLVLDADALRVFVNNKDLINDIKTPFVLTPHYGEFAMLLGTDEKTLKTSFPAFIEEFSEKNSGVIVAKNAPTCIGYNGRIVVNSSGNQGLATAGTGDVLTGVIAGLISQGIPPFDAAQIGTYIHGKAADQLQINTGYRGLIASDLLKEIPKVIRHYEHS